jgi:hypothetical protein
MNRALVAAWETWDGSSRERLELLFTDDGIEARSLITPVNGGPKTRYEIYCDPGWRVHRVLVAIDGDSRSIELRRDSSGAWNDKSGEIAGLNGAIDVDISATPFTNTLPVRRLGLVESAAVEITTAYIALPELSVSPDPQRYTCLVFGRRYRYESLDSDFVREIEVDSEGLVIDYPGLFRRIDSAG